MLHHLARYTRATLAMHHGPRHGTCALCRVTSSPRFIWRRTLSSSSMYLPQSARGVSIGPEAQPAAAATHSMTT